MSAIETVKRFTFIISFTTVNCISFTSNAQISISRQVIASTGLYGAGAGFSLSSTVGESATTTLKGNMVMLTQGFQQPSSVDSIMELHIYNAFSPNGDNINDTWFIDGIEKHPDNTVTIFNRWGIEVWKGVHYDNVDVVWNGTNSAGEELPSATYFYIIRAANTRKSSGWVQLLN